MLQSRCAYFSYLQNRIYGYWNGIFEALLEMYYMRRSISNMNNLLIWILCYVLKLSFYIRRKFSIIAFIYFLQQMSNSAFFIKACKYFTLLRIHRPERICVVYFIIICGEFAWSYFCVFVSPCIVFSTAHTNLTLHTIFVVWR